MRRPNDSAKACRLSDTLLSADGISIVFGGLRAVSEFSCELKEGELVGLIGPNGAGEDHGV
jgi:branched-chain amino acid transport system ATP-binding protein